ncbi:MAG: DNA adenine methyltransferase YhdJ [Pelotomaculum sp. PtaB.Bin104]|nr:MAG: DNA adenine methyltransferase YhdJ [Pelotomaculum sp. PtaB.Bin104]
MVIQKIAAGKLKPASYNPRKDLQPNDPEYQKIERSIKEFGYVDPIIVNKDMTIIGGHQRYKVLVALGYKELDCVVVDLPKDREKALNVALNKISGEWDEALLVELLGELGDLTELTGFDAKEIGELLDKFTEKGEVREDNFDADAEVAKITNPITQRRDVWELGKHRLMCGDSTLASDLEKLMSGQQADLVLTDPPYNVDYEGATKDKLKIQNDKMQDEKFLQFLTDAFILMNKHSKKGAPIYVFHTDSEGYNFRNAFKQAGYLLRQCLVWVKNSLVLGRQDYQWQHEPILYGWKDGASHAWYGDRKQTTLVRFDRPSRNADHPTMKPIGLCGYFIANSSKEGDIVLDPFGGSGSTLIACEQMGRTCYTSELDPIYCDVIVKRYIENTGSDAGVFLLRSGERVPFGQVQ